MPCGNIVPPTSRLFVGTCLLPSSWLLPSRPVEGPDDWQMDYTDTLVPVGVSNIEPQPVWLIDNKTSRRVGILANTIRGVQNLALQHFALRNPVLALNDSTQISMNL